LVIEQLDYGDNDSVVRLKNVINGEQGGISKLRTGKVAVNLFILNLKNTIKLSLNKLNLPKTQKQY
jgi:adenine-specific DNA-methyltransferase